MTNHMIGAKTYTSHMTGKPVNRLEFERNGHNVVISGEPGSDFVMIFIDDVACAKRRLGKEADDYIREHCG